MNWDDRIQKISQAHGFEPGAVEFMVHAIRQGDGRRARWNHQQLGGIGQWLPGRTTLQPPDPGWEKRLDALCEDVLKLLRETGANIWWPKSLGLSPDAAGGQDPVRFAYFADTQRLAVDRGDGKGVTVYDTGEHKIHDVSRPSAAAAAAAPPGDDLVFQSQHGVVPLGTLKVVPPPRGG